MSKTSCYSIKYNKTNEYLTYSTLIHGKFNIAESRHPSYTRPKYFYTSNEAKRYLAQHTSLTYDIKQLCLALSKPSATGSVLFSNYYRYHLFDSTAEILPETFKRLEFTSKYKAKKHLVNLLHHWKLEFDDYYNHEFPKDHPITNKIFSIIENLSLQDFSIVKTTRTTRHR